MDHGKQRITQEKHIQRAEDFQYAIRGRWPVVMVIKPLGDHSWRSDDSGGVVGHSQLKWPRRVA
jgi:hypothetical protein